MASVLIRGGLAGTALITLLSASAPLRADDAPRPCNIPADLARMSQPLPHVASRIAAGQPVIIVAIGSSSTAGAGASSPAASYPSRLAIELTQRFPRQKFNVINRGANGEEVADMLARFETSVVAEKPDLVIWQVGTNSVLRDRPLKPHNGQLHDGLQRMKALGADVVLIDPQFVPKVIVKPELDGMLMLIAGVAKRDNVDLFPRFALMRKWHEIEGIPFDTFVSPDGLHMNDWGYGCLAKVLGASIAEAATRPVASAAASQGLH